MKTNKPPGRAKNSSQDSGAFHRFNNPGHTGADKSNSGDEGPIRRDLLMMLCGNIQGKWHAEKCRISGAFLAVPAKQHQIFCPRVRRQ